MLSLTSLALLPLWLFRLSLRLLLRWLLRLRLLLCWRFRLRLLSLALSSLWLLLLRRKLLFYISSPCLCRCFCFLDICFRWSGLDAPRNASIVGKTISFTQIIIYELLIIFCKAVYHGFRFVSNETIYFF